MSSDDGGDDAVTEYSTEIQIQSQDIPWARYAGRFTAVGIVSSAVVGIVVVALGPTVVIPVLLGHGVFSAVVLFYYIKQMVVRGFNASLGV